MPPTVWSACLLLIVTCTGVDSDNHRLDLDDLLTYYEPLSENFQSNEQMLDHLHYPDISGLQNSQRDSQDVQSNHDPSFSKPLSDSSLSGSRLLHLLPKNEEPETINENADEDDRSRSGRWEPHQSLGLTNKRAGGDSHHRRVKPTRDYKRERNGGMGPSLSVDSSLDVVRQRFIQGLLRNRMIEKQKQIDSNVRLLSDLGKRDGSQASRNHIKQLSSH